MSMTPDKTLEELAESCAMQLGEMLTSWLGISTTDPDTGKPVKEFTASILSALQSATAAQQREVERLRHALENIAGSGCEGEDPEQNCKEFEANPSSYCLPCKADHALSHSGKEGV